MAETHIPDAPTEGVTELAKAMIVVRNAGYKISDRPVNTDNENNSWTENFDWAGDVDDEDEPVRISLTGSIRDAELTESITDAYAKHGPRLADLICNL